MVQKLVDNDIPPNEIIQITRHKNVNSLNNYSSLSDKKQQQISAVFSNAASTSQSLSAVSIEENTKAEAFCRVQLREVYFKIATSQRKMSKFISPVELKSLQRFLVKRN